MDIYSGNVTTDKLGLATVTLPDWFEAENTDFRYQLTVIGRKAQAWIAEQVGHGQFKIASDATNTEISCQSPPCARTSMPGAPAGRRAGKAGS